MSLSGQLLCLFSGFIMTVCHDMYLSVEQDIAATMTHEALLTLIQRQLLSYFLQGKSKAQAAVDERRARA